MCAFISSSFSSEEDDNQLEVVVKSTSVVEFVVPPDKHPFTRPPLFLYDFPDDF
jgi:hypothetical protein